MLKKEIFLVRILATIILMGISGLLFAQNKIDTTASPIILELNDTTYTLNDSLSLARIDSSAVLQDSILMDSTLTDSTLSTSKFDFTSRGGNDTTYYSFYGHIFQSNDTIPIEYWKYNSSVHELEIHNYDSTLKDFHIYNPAFRNSVNNSFVGNTGGAVKSSIYAQPNPYTGYIFMDAYTPYMFQANNVNYYNVSKPFTIFRVDLGSKEEQNLNIVHTQNVNPYLNFHIHFKNYTGDGSYVNQEVRNNAGTIGTVYTKDRFATHFNWVFNNIDAQENGGVADIDQVIVDLVTPSEVKMRLTDGTNYFKDRQLFFDQKIGFLKTNVPDSAQLGGYWFSLQYTHNRQRSVKIYEDTDDSYTNLNGDSLQLYPNTFNGGATVDSNNYFFKNNNFRINLEENPRSYPFVGAYFGYGLESTDYFYSFNKDTSSSYAHKSYKNSAYFEAGIYRLKGKRFKFSGNYKIFISGFKAANMQLDGFISNKFGPQGKEIEVKAEGILASRTPDYYLSSYYSNHYRWDNSFNNENITTLKFSVNIPHLRTNLGSRFNLLSDYIYFNTEGQPTQNNDIFSVFDIYLNNTLKFGQFGLNSRLNYQNSGDETALPLPEFSGYAALYWEPTLNFSSTQGQLKFSTGADVYYWTSYYGQAYSPALSSFHNQTTQKVGNYPFAGVFCNFEIKRLRFYLRYEHATYREVTPRDYFMAPSYPSNPSMFRYGIAWTFYD